MVNLLDHADWSSIDTTTWSEKDWVESFYAVTRAHAISQWSKWANSEPRADFDDVESISMEQLVLAAREWADWAEKKNPTGRYHLSAFWSYLKTRISFRVADYRKKILGRTEPQKEARAVPLSVEAAQELFDSPHAWSSAWWEQAQLTAATEPSVLHELIVDAIAKLTRTEQLMLSLSAIDNMRREDMAVILGVSVYDIRILWRQAVEKLKVASANLLNDEPVDMPTDTKVYVDGGMLTRWVRTNHGMGLDDWLERAIALYRVDLQTVLSLFTVINAADSHRDAALSRQSEEKVTS